jgi:hypothetical protein
MLGWLSGLRNRGIAAQVAMLGIAPLILLAIIGPVIANWGGGNALAGAALAALLCWAGAAVALGVGNLLRGPDLMLAALLLGMTARMGIPLGFGVTVHLLGGRLAQTGTLYYILIFYPVTLLVEVMLMLPKSTQPNSSLTPPKVMP